MSFSITYKEFFRVNISHRYFLNRGNETFDSMPIHEQESMLAQYSIHNFCDIQPTRNTVTKLNGHRLAIRRCNKGFSVWGQVQDNNSGAFEPFISLDDDLALTFLLFIKDPRFINYTSINPGDGLKLHLFSNQRPELEPITFPLISKLGDGGFVDSTYVVSHDTVLQEMKSIPSNQQKHLLGIVRVHMKGEDSTLDVTNGDSYIPSSPVVFEITFDNRKTIWRFIFKTPQTVEPSDDLQVEDGDPRVLVTKVQHPLTQKGYVPIVKDEKELPNPEASTTIVLSASNTNIYSELFM